VVCEGEDVAAYLDSELDADATLRFEEHLAACPLCRTKLREQRSLLCALDVALNDKRSVALPTDFARVIAANAKSDMGGVFDVAERKRALLFCVMLALSSFILLGAAMRDAVLNPAASAVRQSAAVLDLIWRGLYDAGASVAVISRSVGGHLIFESHLYGALALLLLIVSIVLLPSLIIRYHRKKIV